MKKKIFRPLLILSVCLVLIAVLIGCSARNEPFDDIVVRNPSVTGPGNDTEKVTITDIAFDEAVAAITEAVENSSNMSKSEGGTTEWFVIDTQIDYDFIDYLVNPVYQIKFSLIIKANIHLWDNSKSELFFEFRNRALPADQQLRFGVYYIAKTAYLNIGGQKFYTEEINLTQLGSIIAEPFMSSGIDLTSIITGFITGNMGIDLVDTLLSFVSLFDQETMGATKKIVTEGADFKTIDYRFDLQINNIVGILSIPAVRNLLNWETFGLPNLDPLLDKVLGFSLEGILSRQWPRMESTMTFATNHSNKIPVMDAAGDFTYDDNGDKVYKSGFYFNGFKLNLETSEEPMEYALQFVTIPFRLGAAGEKNTITFPSSYNLGDTHKDTVYQKASPFNLELQATLAVDADDNGQITLNDVLGTLVNLGGIGDIPLNFPAQATTYDFTINAKVHLDIFDYSGTKIEATLLFQGTPFIKIYFEKDVLYVNCSALADINGQIIPNIKVSGLNINEMLAPVLESLTPYLDPDYVSLIVPAEAGKNAEGDSEESGGFDIMMLLEMIADNLVETTGPNGESLMGIYLDNVAINNLLAMFLGGDGEVGIPGIMISLDKGNIFNSIKAQIELTDTVSARLTIDKLAYFKEPVFVNDQMIASPVDEATYVDIRNALMRYYGVTLSGEFELGMNKTEGGISLDGLMSALLGDIMLNLGITESASIKVGYILKAALDFSDITNSGMSINFYLAGPGQGTDHVFLVLYYEAAEDCLYIDLSHFGRLKEAMPALKFIGDLPRLKLENVGIRDMLSSINFSIASDAEAPSNLALSDGYSITSPESFIGDIFGGLFLGAGIAYNAAAAEGEGDEDGIDIMDILGQAISINVVDEIKALVINIDRSVLTMLMGMLGIVAPMPDVNAFLKLQLIGVGTLGENTGYLQTYFAILDSLPDENGNYTHAIYLDLQPIRKIQMSISANRPEYFIESFNPTQFIAIDDYLADLVIGLELAGEFSIKSNSPSYTNSYIDAMLAGLISGLSLRFGINGFEMDLGYELKVNLTYTDILALTSGTVPEVLTSSLSIVLKDKSQNIEVLGLYLIDNNIYVDVSYFGMPNIRLNDSSALIAALMGVLGGETEGDEPLPAAYNSPLNSQNGSMDDKVRLQVLVSPDKVSIALTQATIAALLSLFMDSELPVAIMDTEIILWLNDGIALELNTGVEVFSLHASLARFFISLTDEQLPVITLPNKDFYGESSGMPEYIYLSAEGELSLQAEPDIVDGRLVNKYINLTPALRELLGSVELNAYLEMLGFVDGNLYFKLEAAINIASPIDSSVKLLLSAGSSANPNDRTQVMEVLYNRGDLYINTEVFGLGKLYVKDVDNVFTQLTEASEAQKNNRPAGSPANAESDLAHYIEIMFVRGGLTVQVVKDVLLALFAALGADLSPYLAGIDEMTVELGLSINPLDIGFGINIDGVSMGFGVHNVELAFNKSIDLPDTSDYTTIDELKTISVSLNGQFTFEVLGSEEDRRLDFIMDEVRALLAGGGGAIDFDSLLNFGILLQVIGEKFGGTIYYNIDAHIDLLNISNLNLSLKISSFDVYNRYISTGDKSELGDIISFYIISENGALNAYLDATSLGIEKIKIKDIAGLISGFGSDGDTPLEMPANAQGSVSASDILAAHVLISITSNPDNQYNGANAPILVSITQGAFFALFNSMGLDISRFVGPYSPSAELVLGAENEFIAIRFNLKDLLGIEATIENPALEINGNTDAFRQIAEDNSFFLINADDDRLMLKITLSGAFSFNAENTDEHTSVDLTRIIRTFLTEANFGVLLENAGYAGKVIKYDIQLKVNLRKVISGGDLGLAEGLEALILLTVLDSPSAATGKDLSIYLKDGNVYADLRMLNAGKVRIEDVFKIFESEEFESQTVEAASVLNAEFYTLAEQLATSYIVLQMGNTSGLILSVFTDVFTVILNAISLPGTEIGGVGNQLGDIVADTLNNNMLLEIGIGTGSVFEINIELANYDLSFAFGKIDLFFRNSDVIFWDFNPNDYDLIDTNLDEIYLNFNMFFGWELNDGAEFSLAQLIENFAVIDGLRIEPVIAVLKEIGERFRIEVQAVLNLENLLATEMETEEQAEGTDITLVMYNVSGGRNDYVLSIYFVGGDLYLDAECFNIQKVKIQNAFSYFDMISSMLKAVSAETTGGPANAEGGMPKSAEANAVAAYINLLVCPEGFVASVGSAALFAVAQMIGLDISNYIEPIGAIEIEAALLSPSSIIALNLGLLSYEFDNDGNRVIEGYDDQGNPIYKLDGNKIGLFLELSNTYRLSFKVGEGEKLLPPAGAASYTEVNDQVPILGIRTKIFFEASAKEATFPNLNQEPLSSLIYSLLEGMSGDPEGDQTLIEYLKRLVITIFFQISGEQTARFELDVLVNLNILDLLSLEAQIIVNKMDGDVAHKVMQFNLYNRDLFVDLQPLGGPTFCVVETMDFLLGRKKSIYDPADDSRHHKDSAPSNSAPSNEEDGYDNVKPFSLALNITERGLFLFAYKASFNALLNLFNMQDIAMFDFMELNAYMVPENNALTLGVELKIGTETQQDVMKIGLGVEGWRINFVPWSRDELINPGNSRYVNAHDVDTIIAETRLELGFQSNEGSIQLSDLYFALFGDSPLTTTLPQRLDLATLGDTLVIDIKAIVNIASFDNLLDTLQLKVNIFSKKAPDKFWLQVVYYKNTIYIDASRIGLSKIMLEDITGLFDYFGKLASGEPADEDTPEALARYMDRVRELDAITAPSNQEQVEQISAMLAILLSADEGLFITAAKDLLMVVFRLLGMDIEPYIDNVVAPEVKVGINPELSLEVGIKLNSALENNLGALGLKMAFITNKIKVDVADEALFQTPEGIESSIPPIISKEERAQYTNYDKLTVYSDINIKLTVNLQDGRISADNALGAVFKLLGLDAALETDVVFTGGDERMEVEIKGSIGINFERLLSRDPELIKKATAARLELGYAIYDGNGDLYHSQPLASMYLTDDMIYLTLEIMDSHINVRIPDANLSRMFTDLFGVTPGAEEPEPEEPEAAETPIAKLEAGLRNLGRGMPDKETLEAVINLNTQGFYLVITKELLIALMGELSGLFGASAEEGEGSFDLSTIDFEKVFGDILDGASLGAYFDGEDGGFSIRFNLFKYQEDVEGDAGASYPSAGYNIELSLLHNTLITTEPDKYFDFDNYLRDDPALKRMYDSCMDSRDVSWRFTVGLDLVLGADFLPYVLDWSELFRLEEQETMFYLQVLEQLRGKTTMSITVDMLSTGLANLMLDVMVRFTNEAGVEVMAMYFVGNLSQINSKEKEADEDYDFSDVITNPQLYLSVPGMGIDGLLLNSESFEMFLNFNLNRLLESIANSSGEGETPENAPALPKNAEDDDPIPVDDGLDADWWAKLLDSLEFSKGQIAIVVAKTVIQDLLFYFAGIPFDNLGNISLILDNTANLLRFDFSLDNQPEIDMTKIKIGALESMSFAGASWPTAGIAAIDPAFPMFEAGNLIGSYTFVDAFGRNAYYVLFSGVTEQDVDLYTDLFGNYTQEAPDTSNEGVTLYRFYNTSAKAVGIIAHYANGLLTFVFAKDEEYNSSRKYTLDNIEIGTLSQMTPMGNDWPFEELNKLDSLIPVYEGNLLYSFMYYDKEYRRNAVYMLFDGVDEVTMRQYVDHIRASGYQMNRDSNGTYNLSKNSLRFSENGEIKVDVIASVKLYANGTMAVAVSDTTNKYNINFMVRNINVILGKNNIFAAHFEPKGIDYGTYFSTFKPLHEYKWEIETYFELTIDDSVGGLFDLTELTGSLLGGSGALGALNVALQPAEDINIVLGFRLTVFIDFSDLAKLRLQLGITYNGKQIILITYMGDVVDGEEDAVIYADLSGLSFPAIEIRGIKLGGMVKGLMGSLNPDDGETENAPSEGSGPQNAALMNAEGETPTLPVADRINIKDISFGTALLLFTASRKEVSLAITGALAYSLIAGIPGNSFRIPKFKNLKIGYSEEEGLAGLVLRLTDDKPYEQAFRLGFNYRSGYSRFQTGLVSSIDPTKNNIGETIEYQDISTLSQIGLALDLELRIRTKKNADANGLPQKSDQLEMLESLIENLVGMDAGGVNLEPQDSVLVFGVQLRVYANLADLSKTTLHINLTFNEEAFLSIYYFAEKNLVYADLNGLGLFRAAINGVDLMSMLSYMLNGVVDPGIGIDLSKLIGLSASEAIEGAAGSSGAPENAAMNAAEDLLSATDAPLLRILLGNEEITINPNGSFLSSLVTGMALPKFADIRFSTNISYGINNMNLRVKIDNLGNSISLNVAENMLRFAIGEEAKNSQFTIPISLVSDDKFGAISGITLGADSEGSLATNFDTVALLSTLMDTIKLSNLTVYLDKRNDYWYMRDLRWGIPEFATGPNYWGHPGVGTGLGGGAGYDQKVDALKFSIFGYEISFGTTFDPLYFNNAFRRLRLTLNKTTNNAINIRLEQLTQVLGVTTTYSDTSDWRPMTAGAFISDNILKLSLGSALVIDLTPIIERITKMILDAIIQAILPGLGGVLSGLVTEIAAGLLAPILADLLGSVTGYGNPLRLGEIIDDVMGGGIEVFRVFLPELLADDDDEEDPHAVGTLYGRITDREGNGIPGAIVLLEGADKYSTTSDKDGYYTFLNIKSNTYILKAMATGYNELPLPGEPNIQITVKSYLTHPAQQYNITLDVYSVEVFYNVIIRGTIRNSSNSPVAGVSVYLDGSATPFATTQANGTYTATFPQISGRVHTITSSQGHSAAIIITASGQTITCDMTATLPTTGTITGRLVVLEDIELIKGGTLASILSGATPVGETGYVEWDAYANSLDSGVLSPVAGERTRYTDPVYNIRYAVFSGISATDYSNYRSTLGSRGYALEENGTVYHALNTAKKVIVETKHFPSTSTLIVAMKKAENVAVSDGVEIWLERAGRTIRESDSHNGTGVNARLSGNNYYDADDKEGRVLAERTPRNYLKEGNAAGESNINATGYFEIRDLALNTSYILKIRSADYTYRNINVPLMNTTSAYAMMGDIVLTVRPDHWSGQKEAASSIIQSIRLRLGADILDANGDGTTNDPTNPGYATDGLPKTLYSWATDLGEDVVEDIIGAIPYVGGYLGGLFGGGNDPYKDEKGKPIFMPDTNYIDGYEGGAYDRSNNISYVEIWLNSDIITNVFNMVNGFLMPMIGLSAISEDQRYTIADLAVPPSGASNTDIFQYVGEFDENRDEQVYNYVYNNKSQFLMAIKGASAKMPAGLISFVLNLATREVEFLQNEYVRMIIQYAAGALIDEQLDQVSRLISHIFPFTYPYSMAYEKDLPNSPLMQTAVTSTNDANKTTDVKNLMDNEGILKQNVRTVTDDYAPVPETDDNGELLNGYLRDIGFFDMAAYAKLFLNANANTIVDRLVLFINGASYAGSEDRNGIVARNGTDWAPNATVLRADTIRYNPATGQPIAEDLEMAKVIEQWIRRNLVNSYVVVSDYRYTTDEFGVTTKALVGKTYIRDVHGNFDADDWQYGSRTLQGDPEKQKAAAILSAKDDHYFELDLNNTGIRLRVVRSLAGGNKFFNAKDTGSGAIQRTTMEPPEKIVFHDPYNPRDFTAYGGTWALQAEAGVRHNLKTDGTYSVESVLDILPNRNEALFYDGNSSESTGVHVYWDMTGVNFTPTDKDVEGYIIGYCANAVYGKSANGLITKIKAVVEGKLVVDPTSTLRLNDAGNAEIASDEPVLNLDPIDPFHFDKEAYMAKLPATFAYAYKMQYMINGKLDEFNIYGSTTDYVYKRYVFDDLDWDMSETKLTYQGGTAYIKLSYGMSTPLGENKKEKITIQVPIEVLDREVLSVSAPVENSVHGIVDNTITFNPLMHRDLKETMLAINELTLHTAAGDELREVVAVDAESLNSYDPKAIEHPQYTVYYWVEDNFGVRQRIAVTVEVLSRRIVSSTLADHGNITEGGVKITVIEPFRNNGLGLPDVITVFYAGMENGVQLSETLRKADGDFTWAIPDMSYNHNSTEPYKMYNIVAKIGAGDYMQEISVRYRVLQRIPKTVRQIVVPPYGNTSVNNVQKVIFNDGTNDLAAMDTEVHFSLSGTSDPFTSTDTMTVNGTTYKQNIEFINPSFNGRFYYTDVLLYDEYFGTAVVKNVSIAVSMSKLININPPEGTNIKINQYYSDRDIEAFLGMSGLTADIYGATAKASDDYFDIIGWEYEGDTGLPVNGKDAYIKVLVGNDGYATDPVWIQEVLLNVSPYLEDLTVDRLASYTYVIDDPYQYTLPDTVEVIYRKAGVTASNIIPAVYDLGEFADDFYKHASVLGTITIGHENAPIVFEVEFINNDPRSYTSITYYKDAAATQVFEIGEHITFYAFDQIELPQYAKVTFAGKEPPEEKVFNVYWYSIDSYDTEGGLVTAEAWIGDPVFGYIKDKQDFKFTVIGERITGFFDAATGSYVRDFIPDFILLNPYEDITAQLGALVPDTLIVRTDKRDGVTVNVRYPEIPLSYDGQREHRLSFEIGRTNNFGNVGNIRTGQTADYSYEIRESFYSRFLVDDRLATGISLEPNGENLTLEGSIYERINFNELGTLYVLFRNGSRELMNVVWEPEELDKIKYTFLGGAFYINATIGKGIAGLEQKFPVRVFIRPSRLTDLVALEGDLGSSILVLDNENGIQNRIKELRVDPFEGFVGLPERILAKFENEDRMAEVYVNWSYQRIVDTMTLEGQRFDAGNNLAAIATIYDYVEEDDGNGGTVLVRTALQSLEIPVETLTRRILGTEVSRSYEGEDFDNLATEFSLNPYAAPYSEDFASENFSYFRRVRLTVGDPETGYSRTLIFNLDKSNYIIRDAVTGRNTNLNDLYTGRSINVTLSYGKTGGSVSKQAYITRNLYVTILDMRYESGLKDAYYIDVYGAKVDPVNYPEYSQKVEYADGPATLTTASGTPYTFDVIYDAKDINTNFDRFGNKTGSIDYRAGTGRLYAKFGNDYAGYQTITIPVYYEDRTIASLFDKELNPYYGTFTTASGIVREGFIFDPFAEYSIVNNYPQQSAAVRFNTADGITASFNNLDPASKVKVVWNDSKVNITYKGSEDGYVTATVSAADGSAPQTIAYRVKIMDRTVVSYTNVLLTDNYVIKGYDFNNKPDIVAEIANKIFKPAGTVFTVYFAEGDPISFPLGGVARQYASSADILLTSEEEEIPLSFTLDSSRPINYKGKDARFFVKIPGFGMGKAGQQVAFYDVACEEQYIIDVEFYNNTTGTYQSYLTWLNSVEPNAQLPVESGGANVAQNASALQAGNRYVFDIENPYYFIKRGGVPLADKVRIYVGTADGTITRSYPNPDAPGDIETYWSSSRNNRANIYYNRDVITSSFQMDLDNQSFKMTFNVTPWLLSTDLLFFENYAYGSSEIILLPDNAKRSPGVTMIDVSGLVTANDTYTITFMNGLREIFSPVNGGGSYISNYNKWSFDDVNFYSQDEQFAKLTLGGRGGQEIRWRFFTTDKYLVNNTIPSVYTILRGQSVTLPTTFRQLFSGSTYDESKEYSVQYGNLYSTEENRAHGFGQNGRVITGSTLTPSRTVTEGSDFPRGIDNAATAYIEWSAAPVRAYPSTEERVGGKIYFVCYDTPNWVDDGDYMNNLQTFNSYLHNPDASFAFSTIRPGMDLNWQYPADLSISVSANMGSNTYTVPSNSYSHNVAFGGKQTMVPIIQVNQNTLFTNLNLPVVSLTYFRKEIGGGWLGWEGGRPSITADQIYTIPWEKAKVYWTAQPRILENWNHSINHYGTRINSNDAIPDIYFINTGKDKQNNSRVGGRYTLVVPMTFNNGQFGRDNVTYNMVVALDIVDFIF